MCPLVEVRDTMKEEYKVPLAIAHWHLTFALGVLLILLGIGALLLPVFLSSLSIIVIAVSILVPLVSGMQILYAGLVGREFRSVIQYLPVKNIQFDMLRLTMRVSFDGETYHILYHALGAPYTYWVIPTHGVHYYTEGPPEHYQVWTTVSWRTPVHENPYELGKYLRRSGIGDVLFAVQKEPSEDPISDDLKNYGSSKLADISSLCYLGLAKRGGLTILIALLRRDARTDDIIQTIHEIGSIKKRIQVEASQR